MKQTYFPHDSNARNDIKIVRLRKDLGLEGYGAYFCLLEMLFSDKNMMMLDDVDTLAYSLQCDSEVLRAVINNYDLFIINENSFYSARLNETIGEIVKKSARASENAKKRWNKEQTHSEPIAIKVNNSKVKDIKEDKIKTKNLLDKRTLSFKNDVYGLDATEEDKKSFYDYWSEPNKSNTRLRYELQQTWSLKRRMDRWSNSQFNKTSKSKFPDEYVATYSKNLSEPERQLYFKHLVDKGWESVYSPTAGSFWRRKQI